MNGFLYKVGLLCALVARQSTDLFSNREALTNSPKAAGGELLACERYDKVRLA